MDRHMADSMRRRISVASSPTIGGRSTFQRHDQDVGSRSNFRARVDQDVRYPAPRAIQDGANPRSSSTHPSPHFKHNWRLWIFGGPCLGVLLLLGGRPTTLVATLGIMMCYCFDLADHAEGALSFVWLVVVGCTGTLIWAGSGLGFVKLVNIEAFVVLVGIWATLQFSFLYRDEPEITKLLERILLTCFPLPAVAILTWAGVALGGAAYAAPCLALMLYGAVVLYAVPLTPGLGGDGAGRGGELLGASPRIATVLCACMLVLPALVQIAVDHRLLIWDGGAQRWRSLLKVAWAGAVPWPLISSLRHRGVLWWTSFQFRNRLEKALSVGGTLALVVLCETSKSLFLLPTLRPLIHSAPRPPWDSLLASAALYCLVAAWMVHGVGGRRSSLYVARALMVASIRCFGLLVGVGQKAMLLFDISAVALSTLVFTGRRNLMAYVVGVAGMSSFILWFSWQTLWHLKFSFGLPLGPVLGQGGGHGSTSAIPASLSLSLRQVSVSCAALSFGILLVPGLAAFRVRQVAIGIVFGLHSVLLPLLETVLIVTEIRDPRRLEGLFPLPLVAVTGFLGAWMALRLMRHRRIDPLYLCFDLLAHHNHEGVLSLTIAANLENRAVLNPCATLYVGAVVHFLPRRVPGSMNATKVLAWLLANFAPTEAGSAELSYVSTVIPISALVMAATAPFALFRLRPAAPVGRTPPSVGGGRSGSDAAEHWFNPMQAIEAVLCVFFMSMALWVCSGPVISPLLRTLHAGTSGVGSTRRGTQIESRSAHVLALSSFLLALYVLTMVSRHFPDSRTGRRAGAALIAVSVAVLVLRLDVMEGANAGEFPWKEYLQQACGVAAAGAGVLALVGITSPSKNLAGRAVFAFSIGAPLGAWSALASIPRSDAATMSWAATGAAGTYSCALMVLLETALPRAAVWATGAVRGGTGRARSLTASSVLVELYLATVAFMPVAALAQGINILVVGPVGRRFMGLPGRGDVNSDGALRFALATATAGHAVIAVALKLKEATYPSGGSGSGNGRAIGANDGGSGRIGMPLSAAFGEARWRPVLGNGSAILAAAGAFLCFWVHLPGEGARALAAIPSCALLLLLQEDGRLFREGFRFTVPLGALSITWTLSAVYYILVKGILEARSTASFLILGGGLINQAVGVYRNTLHHFHGALGAAESRRLGEGAVALREISFWTADSPWQPLWNLVLLGASIPSHVQLLLFFWGGRGSVQRTSNVLATLVINVLPMVSGDLTSINFLGVVGLFGGAMQLWISRRRQDAGMPLI